MVIMVTIFTVTRYNALVQPPEAACKTMGMLWRQQPPPPHTRDFSSPRASPGFPSHLLLQVTPNRRCRLQTFGLPVSSSSSPVPSTLSESVSPLSLQSQLLFPATSPACSFPPSLLRPGQESERTQRGYLYPEHLTFPLCWPRSIQHRPAARFLRWEAGWTEPCLLPPPPSSYSAPGTGPL